MVVRAPDHGSGSRARVSIGRPALLSFAVAASLFGAPARGEGVTAPPAAAAAASPAAPAPSAPGSSASGSSASASAAAVATPTPAPAELHDLKRCLALADTNAAQIKMARDRLLQTHAQLDEIKWLPWSQFTMSGGAAAVPEIKGTAVYSPNGDISLSSNLGPAWRISIDGVVPLYTFGKISSATAAAEAAVKVAEADVEKFRLLVHHDVRRAYFGVMLANDARYLLNLASKKLADAVKKADDNPDTEEVDLLRMKTYLAEIGARMGEVERGERVALSSLRFLTGVAPPAKLSVPDVPIAGPKKPLSDVLVYLAAARAHRPELKQVKAGVEARRSQVDLAKARLFPDVALAMTFGYSNAPIIADQTNAFVVDNANYLRYGFGVVFRWNLDLLPGAARVRYAEAQLAELRDMESYALGGVGVEVESAYGSARDAMIREKSYAEAEQLSKRWLATITAAMTIGTKEERELIDPLRSFLTNRYNHLQAIMDLDVAFSSLCVATGDESIVEY